MSEPVLLAELPLGGDFFLARATLNAESSLNALTLGMIRRLGEALDQWEQNPKCVAVFLEGKGEKAFCAGGDIRRLYQTMQDRRGQKRNPEAEEFFVEEYALDYRLHRFPKPLIVWGTGFVMGGGMGLFQAGALRAVTEHSKLAMPEISIGLYPDVGASFFLNQLLPGIGLYLSLSAARVSAADAVALGLADVAVPASERETFIASLMQVDFQNPGSLIIEGIKKLAQQFQLTNLGPAEIFERRDRLKKIFTQPSLEGCIEHWELEAREDAFLARGLEAFKKGSPTSARVSFEQLKRCKNLNLEECFALESELTLQFALHHDFSEGVRALIIDKDNQPAWKPARLNEVGPDLVSEHFSTPYQGRPHPWRERVQKKALLFERT